MPLPTPLEVKQKLASLKHTTSPPLPDLEFLPEMKTAAHVLDFAKKHGTIMADLTFVDVPGTLQHTSCPLHELSYSVFAEGFGFDGSSIRGYQEIQESDMLLLPAPATAFLDPFASEPTLSLLCDVKEPGAKGLYDRSPRTIARRATEHLGNSGIADTAYFGPEAEFFIFDHVAYDQGPQGAFYEIDSEEAVWNAGARGRLAPPFEALKGPQALNGSELAGRVEGNLGYKIRHKEGYFPVPPADRHQDVRAAMVRELERAGVRIENFHHEVATAGQAEIDMERDELLTMADNLMRYKYITRNVAHRFGKTVTFMPKPIYGDNASGMHVHQSLWKAGKPLFAGNEYAGLSSLALHYIGGLIAHAPALCAICCPTTNSYKRLVPGFEAPINFVTSARNRSAAVRIPMYFGNPKAKRVEFRTPDPSCNPYLAFSAMLLAGLDGIRRKLDPGPMTDENVYEMQGKKMTKIRKAPADLAEALDALEKDHAFLTKDGVFSETFLQSYLDSKWREVSDERSRPTPSEFFRYYDV